MYFLPLWLDSLGWFFLYLSIPEKMKVLTLSHCMLCEFSCFCCRLLTIICLFSNKKIYSGTWSECQTNWTQIMYSILWVLIWFQTVCKGYLQTTIVAANKERVRILKMLCLLLPCQYLKFKYLIFQPKPLLQVLKITSLVIWIFKLKYKWNQHLKCCFASALRS